MAEKIKQQPHEPVRLRENSIIDGVFFRAGEALPFAREEDLPEALKPLVSRGDEEPPFHPSERNIYEHLRPELRRQARQILGNVQWQAWAEEHAGPEPLPPETQAVLQDEHDRRIALLKAQGEYAQKLTDAAYEAAAQELENRAVVFYVRRGGEMARCDRAKLKAGEKCFTKEESGEWVFAGHIDSTGEPPPQPVVT